MDRTYKVTLTSEHDHTRSYYIIAGSALTAALQSQLAFGETKNRYGNAPRDILAVQVEVADGNVIR